MTIKQASVAVCICATIAIGGCGEDERPVNVAGDYTLNITNGVDECDLPGLSEGDTSTVDFAVTQNGDQIVAEVDSGSIFGGGAGLTALVGSNEFEGRATGNQLHLEIIGDRSFETQGCAHFVTATLVATARGDFLEGKVEYTIVGNGAPACEAIEDCVSTQTFNGARPPSP